MKECPNTVTSKLDFAFGHTMQCNTIVMQWMLNNTKTPNRLIAHHPPRRLVCCLHALTTVLRSKYYGITQKVIVVVMDSHSASEGQATEGPAGSGPVHSVSSFRPSATSHQHRQTSEFGGTLEGGTWNFANATRDSCCSLSPRTATCT